MLSLLALVAAAVVAVAPLPSGAVTLLLALLTLLWALGRPPRRRAWIGGFGLGLTVLASASVWTLDKLPAPPEDAWVAAARQAYVRLCGELESSAETVAASLSDIGTRRTPRLELFRFLQDLTGSRAYRDRTVILYDPDGEALAWAGRGLLYEPELPADGVAFRRGYTALTLFAVAPVSEARRPFRVLVGQSFSTSGLPFQVSGREEGRDVVWSLGEAATGGDDGTAEARRPGAAGDVVRIAPVGLPELFIALRSGRERPEADRPRSSRDGWPGVARRGGAVVLGLTFLALAFLRGVVPGALPGAERRPVARDVVSAAILVACGVGVWVSEAGIQLAAGIALVAGAGLAVWGILRPREPSVEDSGGEILGALGAVALAVAAWLFQRRFESPDLAVDFGGGVDHWALRLTGCLAALGLLTCASRTRAPARCDRAAWFAVVLLLLAAAAHDRPLAALPLLALGGAAAARWLRGVDLAARPVALGGALLLAAMAGAVAWEISYREVFRQRLPEDYLPLVAPPTLDEVNDIHIEIHEHFEGFDLRRVTPPAEGPVDPQDLAFLLWYDSPLPQRDGASALIVQLADGTLSSFSFGLPLRDSTVSFDPKRLPVPPIEPWLDARIDGVAELRLDGKVWGKAEYWFLPRQGFRLEVTEIQELESALLRGEPRRDSFEGLPRSVLFGMYSADGQAIASPWEETPPLAAEVLETPRGRVETPSGPAWYWAADHGDLVEVLFLPRLSPRAGLERVGTHALATLATMAVLVLWVLGIALPAGEVRRLLVRAWHSYSKRLLMVYAILLLAPLVALNLILLRGFEDRLRREQQAEGQAALASARLFLSDFLGGLSSQPGVGINTLINRELLEWISANVRHQVNFYWQSQMQESSQDELFTARLLPRRIPGDVFYRLALLGQSVSGRTQQTGDLAYLELYSLLKEVGAEIFLSVPLVEQEEEVARELATLRRRAALVTAGLVFLVLAVGSRLAASFTKPIMELIEGTREIARGAPFLGVTPREQELSALADAIDEMAQKIAEGRRKLVLEKDVARRMVENITSGVVSLDHRRSVLLHNRVASALLGTEVGVELDRVVEGVEHLHPVAEFLATLDAGDVRELRSATVQLADDQGEVREWTLTWVPVPGPEDPAALLVVDDDTEVLRGQRLEAWAEMARIIAHEIKNPLTPIRLSAEHLRTVYRDDPERLDEVFERCTTNILKQVEELRDIASDFSIYSRIPRAELVDGDLVATLRDLISAYKDASPNGVDLAFSTELDELRARFDNKLLGRAVRNLLENALRATASTARRRSGNGGSQGVLLSVERRATWAIISVEDSGPGVDSENLKRIFEPYFSTHETGTGLGLAIAKRIVEEHGGLLEARNRSGGGLTVTITIPIPESA